MATLPTQVVPLTGLAIAFTAATSSGDQCATGDGVTLLARNNGASPVTVTLVTPELVDGDLAVADRTVTVPANTIGAIAVSSRYRNQTTGLASITYSSATDVDVALIRR
jgi:hypothetical protein